MSKVFVGGLPWSVDDSDLEMAFSHVGDVREAKVINDKDTGRSRGFGFVTFSSAEDAQAAVDLGEIEIEGSDGRARTCNINHAEDNRKGGGGRRRRG